jgi:hypothetical protein
VTGALGIQLPAGVRTGECERIGDKVSGIAAWSAAAAGAGEVPVSQTVVAGSRSERAEDNPELRFGPYRPGRESG